MKEILERLEQKMDAGFAKVDRRLAQMDGRLAQMDGRLDKMDGRLDKMDGRLDKMDGRLDTVDGRFDTVNGRFDTVNGRFDTVDGQLQKQGVLLESVTADVKMALEGITGNREVMDKKFAEILMKLDERVQPIELATRYLATKKTKPR